MKCFVVLLAVAAMASADVGLGYHYKVPHTSYGVPSYQQSGSSGSFGSGFDSSSLTSQPQYQTSGGYQNGGGYQSTNFGSSSGYQGYQGSQHGSSSGNAYQTHQQPATHYQQPATHYQQPATHYIPQAASSTSSGNLGYQTGSTSSLQTGTGSLGYQSSGVSQTINGYQSAEKASALSSYQQYYQQVQQQAPQIFKHFYVHAAPEEPEVPKFRQPQVLPPPQKHYKIIFIKTPTPPAPPVQFLPTQQQNEEKTIVYVLVKKPEEAGEIVIPKLEQKAPSKPEVYFIKYNSKEGSQGVINNIVSDFNTNVGGSLSTHSSGSGSTAGPTFVDGALSDSGSSSVSSNLISGGSSSGGSYSVTQGLADSGNVQSHETSSGYVSGSATGGYQTVTSSDSLVANVQGEGVSQLSNGGYVDSQQHDTFQSIGSSQGLPHSSYGPPNFRS